MSLQGRLVRQALRFAVKPLLAVSPTIPTFRRTMGWLARMPAPPPKHIDLQMTELGGHHAERLAPQGCAARDALLYVHGGGFVAGAAANYRSLTWRLADLLDAPVYAVDYRLAPEHAPPASLDDVTQAYEALLARAERVALMGDSSGGNLVLALAVHAREKGLRPPACIVSLSPPTDLARELPSVQTNADSDALFQREVFACIQAAYVGDADPTDWRLSPARADVRGLPPVLLQCSDSEMLRDYSRLMAGVLERAGVEVTLQIWPELFHVWHMAAGVVPESEEALREAASFIRARLDRCAPQSGG